MMDQQHSVGLADKVRRGHHGRVRKGSNGAQPLMVIEMFPSRTPMARATVSLGCNCKSLKNKRRSYAESSKCSLTGPVLTVSRGC
jgi:hypothetical protein